MPRRCCTGRLADVAPWSRCACSAASKPLNSLPSTPLWRISFLPSPRLRPAPALPIVAPPLDPATGLPLGRIVAEICRVNSLLWYFDLTGIVPDDPAMLLSYRGASGDHYDWHIDIGGGCTASRKLGFTVQLSASSEYVGGDLEFRTIAGDREAFRRKGLMLVFPAYWLHRVTPVTKGNRQVIVGWIHGPSFR